VRDSPPLDVGGGVDSEETMPLPRPPIVALALSLALLSLITCSQPTVPVSVPDADKDTVGGDASADAPDVPDGAPPLDLPGDLDQVGDGGEEDVCVPSCAGKQCGDDGCGGDCGACWADEACFFGFCADAGEAGGPCDEDSDCDDDTPCIEFEGVQRCAPACDPFGEDTCPEGWTCVSPEGDAPFCLPPCQAATCEELEAECGAPSDGCFGALDCGTCGDHEECTEAFTCVCLWESCGDLCCPQGIPCIGGVCHDGPPPCDPPCPDGQTCVDGACCALTDATCDGVDEDCDGQTDDDWSGAATCGVGVCAEGATPATCLEGVETPCEPGPPAADVDETCDGADDDCDGGIDEDYAPDGTCGVGACQTGNVASACVDGNEFPCQPGEPLGDTDPTCDGADDDCDGVADEDYVSATICGTGWCKVTATPSACTDGVETPCIPGPAASPVDDTCNGVDDDCNGDTDEDYLIDPSCGVGVCLAFNAPSSCAGGVETPCVPGAPLAAQDLTCDGMDDDCDGLEDEDYVPQVECGMGWCKVSAVPSTCLDGVETACVPGAPLVAVDDDCDQIDGDCDGETDEDAVEGCVYGDPVIGAEVIFESSIGRAAGLTTDHGDGTYSDALVALTVPGASGGVSAQAWETVATQKGLAIAAGIPVAMELTLSRDLVTADDPSVRACVFVVDLFGQPVNGALGVTMSWDHGSGVAEAFASSIGMGMHCAWLTAPSFLFDVGASGPVTATAGAMASLPTTLEALAAPAPLDLASGTVGLRLPLGPRFPGTTFTVPVVVNTGGDVIGSYKFELLFDPTVLEVTGLDTGPTGDLSPPVSNLETTANELGSLSFNSINADPGAGAAAGSAVVVAQVHFAVRSDALPGAAGLVTGTAAELFNTVYVSILEAADMVAWGAMGEGASATVLVDAPSPRAVHAYPQDNALLDLASLTGDAAATPLRVPVLHRDGGVFDLGAAPETSCDAWDEGIAVATGCVAVAKGRGVTSVTASIGELDATTLVRVLTPDLPLDLQVRDAKLSYINDLDQLQQTTVRAVATLSDDDLYAFTMDASDLVEFVSSNGAVLVIPGGSQKVLAGDNGAASVFAIGSGGGLLGSVEVLVDGGESVTATGLEILVPARLQIDSISPAQVDPIDGIATATATLTNLLTAEGQTVQARGLLVLSDDLETAGGSRIDVTDSDAMDWESATPGIGAVDEDGVLTAVSAGSGGVDGTYSDVFGDELVSGSGEYEVQLPPPTKVTASIANPRLALSAADSSHVVRGLPVSRQITVVVHFADGSTKDLTQDPRTTFGVGGGLVLVDSFAVCGGVPGCAPGTVASTGVGHGAATIAIGFDDPYLGGVSTTLAVEVVAQEALQLGLFELYTPGGAQPVPEEQLSFIEGTDVRQRARVQVTDVYTDGVALDVSQHAATSFVVTADGSGTPAPAAMTVSPDRILSGNQAGIWDLEAWSNGNASGKTSVVVPALSEDLLEFSLTHPGGSTLLGVKDQGTSALRVVGTFADGTHNVLTGAELIPGLLAFATTDPDKATVASDGVTTVRGNGPVTFLVGVADGADAGGFFSNIASRYLPVNLTPAVGDVDMGQPVGLPFPDRDADEIFEFPIRVNTGAAALGGVDLEITYDPGVLEATDVVVGADLVGGLFSANVGTPGLIYLNATPPLSQQTFGASVEVAVVTFKALKAPGGPQISAMGGTVVGFLDLDGEAIGGAPPRAIIAGDGDLDPAPGDVWGDADDDEGFSVGDVLFIQKTIVEPPLVTPNETQIAQSDLFPDGAVTSNDAFFGSQALARLTHFVEVGVTGTPGLPGAFELTATVTDRDQAPVTEGVRVRFEVSAPLNVGGVSFTLPHEDSPSGVVTEATGAGDGTWNTQILGVTENEEIGIVVLLDVLDAGGEVLATTAFLGSKLLDPDATFIPMTTFSAELCFPDCDGLLCGADDGCGGLCDGPCSAPMTSCQEGACVCTWKECGGTCCLEGDTCQGDACCTPAACEDQGAVCGYVPDGCGNMLPCGDCAGGQTCDIDNQCTCETVECGGVCCAADETCVDGLCTFQGCVPDCADKICGLDDGCGDPCDGPCPGANETCEAGACVCDGPSCGGGCCAAGEACQAGVCVEACVPDCSDKLCGDSDGCEGVCDDAPCEDPDAFCLFGGCECLYVLCGDTCCAAGQDCEDGVCGGCVPDCDAAACGDPDGCGGQCDGYCSGDNEACQGFTCACQYKDCGACCAAGQVCDGDTCCTPTTCQAVGASCGHPLDGCGNTLICGDCANNEVCGDDYSCACPTPMCGGLCCPAGEACEDGACVSCDPVCAPDAACGDDDGCGGGCQGACPGAQEYCSDGACECYFESCGGECCEPGYVCDADDLCVPPCEPTCLGKLCGEDDGCGTPCDGLCPGGDQVCEDGACVCVFAACGGGCCAPGEVCDGGVCCAPTSCELLGAQCGNPPDGCGGTLTCDGCGPNTGCDGNFQCECAYSECGGACCNEGETCDGGACCPPMTCEGMGAECGSPANGCGGDLDCGTCDDLKTCTDDWLCECTFVSCNGVCCGAQEICLGGACISTCEAECDGKMCGDDDGCGDPCTGPCPDTDETCSGGVCVCDGVLCASDCCPAGQGCLGGVCADCTPSCDGKGCGDSDGCGGTCAGSCPGDYEECVDGACICLYEDCGDACCGAEQACHQGACCTPSICQDLPGVECGFTSDGCGGLLDCGGCGADEVCDAQNQCACEFEACGGVCCGLGQPCIGGACCVPSCVGKSCGDPDDCGGLCDGPCGGLYEACVDGACQCEFLSCGDSCCGAGETCVDGLCVGCMPDCDGKLCGADDSCGGLCDGPCPGEDEICAGGQCYCAWLPCGDDCCGPEETCFDEACCAPTTCEDLGATCGTPDDGCGGLLDCGGCEGDAVCSDAFTCECAFETCGELCCPEGWVCEDGACCDVVTCDDLGVECGLPTDGCGGVIYCGACAGLQFCGGDFTCECLYEACGDTCCGAEEACIAGACVSTCEADCAGKACGVDDGCGQPCDGPCSDPDALCLLPTGCVCAGVTCGGDCCPSGEACVGGVCAPCTPDCADAGCGDADGCGGVCDTGACPGDNETCEEGVCVCDVALCGGACCAAAQVCHDDACCTPETSCEVLGATCGEPADGCGDVLACGACPAYAECNDAFECECQWESCDDLCCDQGQACVDGACCVPDCAGAQCGDADGCGGLCDGPCTDILYQECVAGACACIHDACAGGCCPPGETCQGGACAPCDPVCDGASCGDDDGCGGLCDGACPGAEEVCFDGLCVCAFSACGDACCGEGELCADGLCCTPLTCVETGAACGTPPDGCGGTLDCGSCGGGATCTQDFQCQCDGLSCGDACCSPGEVCHQGSCCGPLTCEGEGIECGTLIDGCGASLDCGTCGANEDCSFLQTCVCVDVSCGGLCCAPGQTCQGGACTGSCVPSCAGKTCGADDGCGGVCDGSCVGANEVCSAGACVCEFEACGGGCCAYDETCVGGACVLCTPDCAGASCGDDDGCGGLCDGACPGPDEVCEAGACVCEYDACDGACCAEDAVCTPGGCCEPTSCGDLDAQCGSPSDGCGGTLDCGTCGPLSECGVDWQCACANAECDGACCDAAEVCFGGGCCAPSCGGASCGDDDGCGGLCAGSCAETFANCEAGACVCQYITCGESCCGPGEPCEAGECVACQTDCAGKACGADDGCEGLCDGPCPGEHELCLFGQCECDNAPCGDGCCDVDEVCHAGACCAPTTCDLLGATCGTPGDGCGGLLSCGDCPDDQFCGDDFACDCSFDSCGDTCCAEGSICFEGGCCGPQTCALLGVECGPASDGCGGDLSCGGCPPGEACDAGQCAPCTPDCNTAFCGDDDGCGGLCDGPCPGAFEVCQDGACECANVPCGDGCCASGEQCSAGVCVPCQPDCDGAGCGDDDGCGGICDGLCAGANELCLDGLCVCESLACGDACCGDGEVCDQGACCAPQTCEDLGASCGEPADGCGGVLFCGDCGPAETCSGTFQCECAGVVCGDACCADGEACLAGACCAPSCDGAACGDDDGCGGLCDGFCAGANEACVAGTCECEAVECDGTCCAVGEVCDAGTCVACIPDCAGAACGDDDGCDGLCFGTCEDPDASCFDGLCTCDYLACGDECCGPGQGCAEGVCCDIATCDGLGATCGTPPDGCGGTLECGACGPAEACGDGWTCECAHVTCGDACCGMGELCHQGACCSPQTCVTAGTDCGAPPDGCGGTLDCGTCGANATCDGSFVCTCDHVACGDACCAAGELCDGGTCTACVPDCAGAGCGDDDGCGGLCQGPCPGDNESCVDGACACAFVDCAGVCCGEAAVCDQGACCAPETCATLGVTCGAPADGCGGTLSCGTCGADASCGVDYHCECDFTVCGDACCPDGASCVDDACCTPATCAELGFECGLQTDGCDGGLDCGDCAGGLTCFEGSCVDCVPACAGASCGDADGCGGLCDGACAGADEVCVDGACTCVYVTCGDACCADGETCNAGVCGPCVPDCAVADCGDADGCGGLCEGPCPGDFEACVGGACTCSYIGCGDTCCAPDAVCDGGACCVPSTCGELGASCGAPSDGCGGTLACGGCGGNEVCGPGFQCGCEYQECDGACCNEGALCYDGSCCAPATCDSLGADCGAPTDGCGGSLDCGTCGPLEACSDFGCDCLYQDCDGACCGETEDCIGGVCTPCQPDCVGAFCGDDDGCGGLCDGSCPLSWQVCDQGLCDCEFVECVGVCCGPDDGCLDGTCVPCVPDCAGAACGADDGCGGVCPDGTCAGANESCVSGECACDFEDCGGACCDAGAVCHLGGCCAPNTCEVLSALCGAPGDGCGGTLDCGACSDGQVCSDTWQCECAFEVCGTQCCLEDEVCAGGSCCAPTCAGKNCGEADGCGGLCQGTCPDAFETCVAGACVCPNVSCGGICCGPDQACNLGECVDCVPDCDSAVCGDADGCGGLCQGPCPGDHATCVEGICSCTEFECGGDCCAPGDECHAGACCTPTTCGALGADCGSPSNGCGDTLDCGDCGVWGSCDDGNQCDCDHLACGGDCCADGDLCFAGACCTPATCADLDADCGTPSDGCGGTLTCGTCGDDEVCSGAYACECVYESCNGVCCAEGKVCSGGACACPYEECGGVCCADGETCQAGACVPDCVPDCAGASCGDADGCGGLCDGTCVGDNEVCSLGTCVCDGPPCDGGCCAADQSCVLGVCTDVCVPSCADKDCGDDDGCGGTCLLGPCPIPGEVCVLGTCI